LYTSTEIEDAILYTLGQDSVLAGYVRLFTAIPSLDIDVLQQEILVFPAIGVVSPSGEYKYLSGGRSATQVETGLFDVLCFNKNLRSRTAPVHGVAGEKGLWEMIEDCRLVLLSHLYQTGTTEMSVASCLPRRRQLIYADKSFAIASLQTEVKWGD